MISLQRVEKLHIFTLVSRLCIGSSPTSSKSSLYANGHRPISQFPRFSTFQVDFHEKRHLQVRREAQAALLDYFYETRNLPFLDAENLSRNSPNFLNRLLKAVLIYGDGENDCDFRRLVTRYLRYHPVNEFEAFFESIGLCPSDYASFLPCVSVSLSDDELLLHNYYVLCNYGIEKSRIGKVYMEAKEVFSYNDGVLQSKIKSFENWGLRHSLVVEIISCSPHLLIGGDNQEFHDFLEEIKKLGLNLGWLEKHVRGCDYCDWKCMLEVMCLLGELGLRDEQIGQVIKNHPGLLLECSGRCTLCLFGLLLKFGTTPSGAQAVFHHFPKVSVAGFTRNLLRSYQFLVGINMPFRDIVRMFSLYPLLLGTCQLKKVGSLVHLLNCGVSRICKMVEEDPYVLRKWIRGVRVERLQQPSRAARGRGVKARFLETLGFVEKSCEMERILRLLMGKGEELQERFDCIVNSGLSQENALAMLRSNPRVLNMSKDVIERKIDVIVRELGYPVSVVLTHPILFTYTTKRLKLRLLMHKWLKDEGSVKAESSLRSFLKYPEERFVRCYVNPHPGGTLVWEILKRKMDSSSEMA
ncbi:hypothetical protein SASPL_141007 [Salvia splendens]|uniref:mTERF domain-containing protein, mitochondrial n=1 Tax=Salvia splendens TaxID=180675 RepID=A0A8X8WT91_SALSN|nr:hypothetical protein SASPL_141007 [Salvia splendens]